MLRIDSGKKARARKQAGFVVTAELLLITTILGLGLITGYTKVRDQVLAELSDTGAAIGSINQSYEVHGTQWTNTHLIAEVSGFAFNDAADVDQGEGGAVGGDTQQVIYAVAPVPSTTYLGAGEGGIQP